MSHQPTQVARQFVFIEDVVRLTGLSASTIRRRVRDGKIKAIQPGGRKSRLLFDAETLGINPEAATSGGHTSPADVSNKPKTQQLRGPKLNWL